MPVETEIFREASFFAEASRCPPVRSIGSAYANRRDDDRVIQEVNQTIKNNAPAAPYGRASPS